MGIQNIMAKVNMGLIEGVCSTHAILARCRLRPAMAGSLLQMPMPPLFWKPELLKPVSNKPKGTLTSNFYRKLFVFNIQTVFFCFFVVLCFFFPPLFLHFLYIGPFGPSPIFVWKNQPYYLDETNRSAPSKAP